MYKICIAGSETSAAKKINAQPNLLSCRWCRNWSVALPFAFITIFLNKVAQQEIVCCCSDVCLALPSIVNIVIKTSVYFAMNWTRHHSRFYSFPLFCYVQIFVHLLTFHSRLRNLRSWLSSSAFVDFWLDYSISNVLNIMSGLKEILAAIT